MFENVVLKRELGHEEEEVTKRWRKLSHQIKNDNKKAVSQQEIKLVLCFTQDFVIHLSRQRM
jgi:rRNA maturation endonuclease Nob1